MPFIFITFGYIYSGKCISCGAWGYRTFENVKDI